MTTPKEATYKLPGIKISSSNWQKFYSIVSDDLIYSIALLLAKPSLSYIEVDDLAVITIEDNKQDSNRTKGCRLHLDNGYEVRAEGFWNLLGRYILKEYEINNPNKPIFNDFFSFNYLMRNYFKTISQKNVLMEEDDVSYKYRRKLYQAAAIKMIYKAANNIRNEINTIIALWNDLLKLEKRLDPSFILADDKCISKLFEVAKREVNNMKLDFFTKESIQNIDAITMLYFFCLDGNTWTLDYFSDIPLSDDVNASKKSNACSYFRIYYSSLIGNKILLDDELSIYLYDGKKNFFIDIFADALGKGKYDKFFDSMDKKIKDNTHLSGKSFDETRFFVRYAFIDYAYKLIDKFYSKHSKELDTLMRYSY